MITINKKIFPIHIKDISKELSKYLNQIHKHLTSYDHIYGKSREYIFISKDNIEQLVSFIEADIVSFFDIFISDKKVGFCITGVNVKLFMGAPSATIYFMYMAKKNFNKKNFNEVIQLTKRYYDRKGYKHFNIDFPIEYKDLIDETDGSFETNIYREYLTQ